METKEILKRLRESHQLTQEQMAERLMVTRQAVSRWENGETQPNTETLKLLSREFHVSVNTLLGRPAAAYLPVLRNAPERGRQHQPRGGRKLQ